MQNKQNLHIHSTFCDGKDTPEEMVNEAILRGFDSIGFSGHAYMKICPQFTMTPEVTKEYEKEILRLKEKYKGIIDIYLGIEYDIFCDCPVGDYEYTIGSLHYLNTRNGIIGFDRSGEEVMRFLTDCYDGDGMKFARHYYETLATLPQYGNFDILGHIDILTKNNEKLNFVDVTDKEYLGYAKEAIEALKGKIDIFEVNTGAISRGYRTSPYPQKEILRSLCENGFKVTISSDCHNKDFIDCFYDESVELLRETGFKSRVIFNGKGFEEVSL